MLEDLDFLYGTGKYHFLGSIVLNSLPNPYNDDIEYYDIVDGQQRITTIILILIVIAQIFKERNEYALFQGLMHYIQTTSINNHTSCTLRTDVHSCVVNLVSCVAETDTPFNTMQLLITNCITNKKQDAIIERCLKYYYDTLKNRSTEEIAKFRNALISTNYVNIRATEEDAYTVFEILNARGMDLEDYELLKNFILCYTVPIDNVDIARQEWKEEIENRLGKNITNFLKHYIAHKYGIAGVTKNRAVYDVIKKHISVGEVNRLFCDLKLKAKYYQRIVCESNMTENQVSEIDRVLKFMLSNNKVPAAVGDFCKWLNDEIATVDRKDIAACYRLSFEAHFRLVTIHPWVDGNGRASRLVMNTIQRQLGLVPSIVRKEDKGEYIQSLVDSRENEDSTIAQDTMLRHHIDNINRRVSEYKQNSGDDTVNPKNDTLNDTVNSQTDTATKLKGSLQKIYSAIADNPGLTHSEMTAIFNISESTAKRATKELKRLGVIKREGSDKTGKWIILK